MNQQTKRFRLPQLKLAHKGVIILVLPLVVQAGCYVELKRQMAATEAQARKADARREIVTLVNALFISGFDSFNALVTFSAYGGRDRSRSRDAYMQKLKSQIGELADRLERDAKEPKTAETLREYGRAYTRAFESWHTKIDKGDAQAFSLFTGIEENNKFKSSALQFMRLLRKIGEAQQAKLAPESSIEYNARADLQRSMDLAVTLSAFIAILLGVFFLRGTVSQLSILKSNASRFARKELLHAPLSVNDEVGEVDKVFHEMANALTAAQVKEHEMLDQLQAGKDRLDRVIENIPLAVVVTDEKGIIQSFNATAEKTFQYSREDISGKPLTVLFSGTGKEKTSAEFLSMLAGETGKSLQLEALSSEKELIPAEVSTTRFDSPEGVRYLATIKDISERFRLEQMKRDFYAMVSHDIRTPLSSINGILQLVQRGRYGEIPDEVDEKLGTAEKNVDKLLALVSKLVEIEKLESGNLELSISSVKLDDLIAQSIDSTAQFAEAHKVELATEPTALRLNADALYIGNVLTNLISNAIKFSPENSKVSISAKDLGEFVEVSILDEGPGVPARMQSQIFEKYRQAKPTRDRAKGFGLGLAICKSIVELHGGSIGVESKDGKENESTGSRFWFRLRKAVS
ncbi:MAG: PAS domain S-box protein [Candidatus Obscuribacterales bacterium]|nr:PAS domain S-box protein [Candidatus Obscuribacterales bacterium]